MTMCGIFDPGQCSVSVCTEEWCSGSSDSSRHSKYNLSNLIHQKRRCGLISPAPGAFSYARYSAKVTYTAIHILRLVLFFCKNYTELIEVETWII